MGRAAGTGAPGRARLRSRGPPTRGRSPALLVVDPVARGPQHDRGRDEDDHEEDPREGRCVAHVEVAEGLVVQLDDVEEQGSVLAADRAAPPAYRALADDVGLGE